MPAFRLDVAREVAVLTMDLPGSSANLLSEDVLLEFKLVLRELQGWPRAHGLILCSGKPGVFCRGADLKELAAAHSAKRRVQSGLLAVTTLETLPFPTAAIIDGICMGGGLELALGCDFRIAGSHPKCRFGLPVTRFGLVPCWGGTLSHAPADQLESLVQSASEPNSHARFDAGIRSMRLELACISECAECARAN